MEEELEFGYTNRGMFYIIGYKTRESDKFYGEIIFLKDINIGEGFDIYARGFCCDSLLFGILKNNSVNEFYSIFEPGKGINEFEYRKELFSIRVDERNEPEHFKWYDKTLPDNWLELFKEKLDNDLNKRALVLKLGGEKKGFKIND